MNKYHDFITDKEIKNTRTNFAVVARKMETRIDLDAAHTEHAYVVGGRDTVSFVPSILFSPFFVCDVPARVIRPPTKREPVTPRRDTVDFAEFLGKISIISGIAF